MVQRKLPPGKLLLTALESLLKNKRVEEFPGRHFYITVDDFEQILGYANPKLLYANTEIGLPK